MGEQLPPFLAVKPEWATLFANDWLSIPPTPETRTRSPDTQPTVEPFHGVSDHQISWALSRNVDEAWKSTLPFTYVLDYSPDHLGNDDYIRTIATAPPTLLHLGKDLPFTHGWGPIKALGGENQSSCKEEHIVRISSDDVKVRITRLRQMVDELHASGLEAQPCGQRPDLQSWRITNAVAGKQG